MAANQVRKFSSEAELTEFIAKYVADVLSGKESAAHAAEDKLMKRNSALPERADLALEIRADGSAIVSFAEPDGSKTEAVYPSLAIMVVSMLADSIIGDDWQVEFQRVSNASQNPHRP